MGNKSAIKAWDGTDPISTRMVFSAQLQAKHEEIYPPIQMKSDIIILSFLRNVFLVLITNS